MKISSGHLITALGIYSFCVVAVISFLILASQDTNVHQKATIKMALGLILFWVVIGGALMYRYREPVGRYIRNIPLNWKLKFVIFATILGGFWFFVYGLMVFLPAYSIPPAEPRGARTPKFRHYVLAVVLPLVSPAILLPIAPLLRYLYDLMDPVFFVKSPFA
jgi:hypothetical protein